MNAAILERLNRHGDVAGVLTVEWSVRGYPLGTMRISTGSWALEGVAVIGSVVPGGFGPVTIGASVSAPNIAVVKTTVRFEDVGGVVRQMFETYGPVGSAAWTAAGSPGLIPADWGRVFTGVVEDCQFEGGIGTLSLAVDSGPLATPGPKPIFSRSECSAAYDPSIWGTPMPIVLGIHDSFKVTGRGMLPAVNVRWDETLGYWWTASVGNLRAIPRIYYDGKPQTAGFSILRGVYGGTYQTIIEVDPAYLPEEGAVVSFDCEGPDSSGGIAGASETHPIKLLRAWLNNYVFRDNRTGVWNLTDVARLNGTALDAAEDWFQDVAGAEGAFRFGGESARTEPQKELEAFAKCHPIRFFWDELGRLSCFLLECGDEDPGDRLNVDGTVLSGPKLIGAEKKLSLTGIVTPYLYSHSQEEFIASIEAHDIGWTDEGSRVTDEVENRYAQGRYDLEA